VAISCSCAKAWDCHILFSLRNDVYGNLDS
jgi:hypothetical protein